MPWRGEGISTWAPFHLEATVRVLQRRPTNLVDRWEREEYERVLELSVGPVLARVSNRGTVDGPEIWLSLHPDDLAPGVRAEAIRTVRKVLGLDVEPVRLEKAARGERSLRAVVGALRGMRPPRFASLFETFANVVPFQQVSLDAGLAVVRRLVQGCGARIEVDGRGHHVFPTAETVAGASPSRLRACGMSWRKVNTLLDLARRVAAGELSEEGLSTMPTQEALAYLETFPGVGPWSAALVLLRGLGRLDVFPPGDAGAERALGSLIGRGSDAQLNAVVDRAGEHRGYLYFCALGASLMDRGLITLHPRSAMSK